MTDFSEQTYNSHNGGAFEIVDIVPQATAENGGGEHVMIIDVVPPASKIMAVRSMVVEAQPGAEQKVKYIGIKTVVQGRFNDCYIDYGHFDNLDVTKLSAQSLVHLFGPDGGIGNKLRAIVVFDSGALPNRVLFYVHGVQMPKGNVGFVTNLD